MSILTDTAPRRIYLCVSDDADDNDKPYPETYPEDETITWSTTGAVACTVEYVRADMHDALVDKALRFDLDQAGIERREQEATELVELRSQRDILRQHLHDEHQRHVADDDGALPARPRSAGRRRAEFFS